MSEGSSTPPKFIPVLTEVVTDEPAVQTANGGAGGVAWGKLGAHQWIGRRTSSEVPAQLPPLPDSLPPQAFPETAFASRAQNQALVSRTEPSSEEAAVPPMQVIAGDSAAASMTQQLAGQVQIADLLPSSREQWAARLMQEVQASIAPSLQSRMAELVREHAQALELQLREEIAAALQQGIADALHGLSGQDLDEGEAPKP